MIAPIPANMMMIAITQAKIGRSMKTLDIRQPPRAELPAPFIAPGGGA
jgi:hypothetical protein